MGNRKRIRIIRKLLLAVIVVCLIRIGQLYYLSAEHSAQQEKLRKMTEVSEKTAEDSGESREASSEAGGEGREASSEDAGERQEVPEEEKTHTEEKEEAQKETAQSDSAGKDSLPEEKETVMLRKYVSLYEENSDLAGWLSIEGTEIDYPVMQCSDDEYYLHHDFYGEESRYGCLYVKGEADIETGTNFIIYGHNMKDGSMFGELDLYKKESFYPDHAVISFDTLYEERSYEIVAVFPSQVYDRDDDVFKYYQFYEADSRTEFDTFYKKIRELSLYDTGVEAEFGDTFLTLSTCAYHVEDGRFVIVAKRIDRV